MEIRQIPSDIVLDILVESGKIALSVFLPHFRAIFNQYICINRDIGTNRYIHFQVHLTDNDNIQL